MDTILNCNLDDTEDYYILLGCDELSTVEQILAEFKVKALECHPDKHPGNPKAAAGNKEDPAPCDRPALRRPTTNIRNCRNDVSHADNLNLAPITVPSGKTGYSETVENFQKLQQAKEILTNEESRASYDYWRRSKITIPFQQWEALSDSIKTSMHWAVRSKNEPMLEAPELNNSNNITNDTWAQQTENNKDGLSAERREQDDAETSDEKPQSPKSPDSPRFLDANCSHLRFRWSGDAPSELLRKFRNYEI